MRFLRHIFRKECGADFWAELEESLLAADVGVEVTGQLLAAAQKEKSPDAVRGALARQMIEILARPFRASTGPGRTEGRPPGGSTSSSSTPPGASTRRRI